MRPLETIMNRGCQRVGPSKPYDAGDPGFRYRKEIDGDPNRNENCTRQNFSNNGFLGPPCCLVPTGYVIRAINLVRRCEFGGKLLQQLVIQRPNAHSTIQVMIGRRKGDFMSGPLTTRGYIIAIVLSKFGGAETPAFRHGEEAPPFLFPQNVLSARLFVDIGRTSEDGYVEESV